MAQWAWLRQAPRSILPKKREGLSSAKGVSITSAARVLAIGTANRCADRVGGRGNVVAVAQATRLRCARRSIYDCINQQRRLRSARKMSTTSAAGVLATSTAGRCVDHEVERGECSCAIAEARTARPGIARRSNCSIPCSGLRSAKRLSIASTAGALAVSAADREVSSGEDYAIAVAWVASPGDC